MSVQPTHIARSRAQTIELALDAMAWVMCEETIPCSVRREIALAHASLHACRDAATVAHMEREKGLRP